MNSLTFIYGNGCPGIMFGSQFSFAGVRAFTRRVGPSALSVLLLFVSRNSSSAGNGFWSYKSAFRPLKVSQRFAQRSVGRFHLFPFISGLFLPGAGKGFVFTLPALNQFPPSVSLGSTWLGSLRVVFLATLHGLPNGVGV